MCAKEFHVVPRNSMLCQGMTELSMHYGNSRKCQEIPCCVVPRNDKPWDFQRIPSHGTLMTGKCHSVECHVIPSAVIFWMRQYQNTVPYTGISWYFQIIPGLCPNISYWNILENAGIFRQFPVQFHQGILSQNFIYSVSEKYPIIAFRKKLASFLICLELSSNLSSSRLSLCKIILQKISQDLINLARI